MACRDKYQANRMTDFMINRGLEMIELFLNNHPISIFNMLLQYNISVLLR